MARQSLATRVVHAGEPGEAAFGALSAPISQAAVYRLPSAAEAARIHEGEVPAFFYGRMGTPTQALLEAAMAELEGGEAALATASGMSALCLALLAALAPGGHLVAQRSLYSSTAALLDAVLEPMGIEVTRVDASRPHEVAEALRPTTRALLLETPSNPMLRLCDLRALSEMAHAAGASVLVDSTFATPVNQLPLMLGADLVVHSASKYLGGHGDLVAGVLVGSSELVERARWQGMRLMGPVIAPFTAWLVLRGLRTLAIRVARHNESALCVARSLEDHAKVRSVHYPGLASHPEHELARRQMSGFGGVVAFDVGSAATAARLVDRVRLCTLGVSLGDVATLIQHSSRMTQASLSTRQRRKAGIPAGLLRLSVGLEEARDIIDDLDRALSAARVPRRSRPS
jgi:methionine-gamma-lyase